ncbi:MAG: hypothetical protein WAM69_08850 [Candidatus Sulfotelmatobacter sp.]
MSGFVEWIAAQADGQDQAADALSKRHAVRAQTDKQSVCESSATSASWQELPTHHFPARPPIAGEAPRWNPPGQDRARDWERDPDLWLYRKKTSALLRRYMRWSLEAGRLPSLLGRELFRARITTYTATTFEAGNLST